MQIYHNIEEWKLTRQNLPSHLSLGFVPTMGNLHVGHLSLIAASQRENDLTMASIFVNPTQFNQATDYAQYPRTLDADILKLQESGVDYCLIPNEQNIYTDDYRYKLSETKQSELLEGEFRPGHFDGVLTVVMKLLNIVKPHRSYFGEKDYQQYLLIRDMVAAFFMDIEIKSCPTIRESTGLAYSSRNTLLTPEERKLADQFAHTFHELKTCEEIINKLSELKISVDYIRDYNNRRYAAVKIGNIRLIDNFTISKI